MGITINKSLIAKDKQLPARLQDLRRFVLIGREKLNAVRAEIRVIDKLGLAAGVREQKKDEAQMLGGALLDAEVRVGELTSKIPLGSGGNRGNQYVGGKNRTAADFGKTKKQIIKELGFSGDQVDRFEDMAENKDIIEQVKKEAKENEDIPTRSEVLQKIQDLNREKTRKAAADKRAAEYAKYKQESAVSERMDLRCGDCVKILPMIQDNSVNLVLTDPPYNIDLEYNSYKDSLDDEDYSMWCKKWLTEIYRVLKNKHYGVIFTGDLKSYYVFKAIMESGLTFHHFLKWHKGTTARASLSGSNLFYRTELAFLVSKGKPDTYLINRPKFYQDTISLENTLSTQSDLVDHPARRPAALYRFIINGFTQEGDTVCDPMMGSGSSGIAAKELGRRYIGIEIDKYYFNIARSRINNAKEGGSLEDVLMGDEGTDTEEIEKVYCQKA